MGFFKKIDKVFSSSSSFHLLDRNEVDLHIEENIKSVGIAKYAISDYGDVYITIHELGGFLMLETILVSATNVKSKKGSKLTFFAKDATLKFDSDEDRIESDFSKDANRYSSACIALRIAIGLVSTAATSTIFTVTISAAKVRWA